LPTDQFHFAGFAPPKSAARKKFLQTLASVPATLILFETGPRLAAMLDDARAVLGDRRATIAREVTKFYEEFNRASLSTLAAQYAVREPPKGEIVVVVEGARGEPASVEAPALEAALQEALARGSLKQAVADVTAALGLKRRDVYAAALKLTGAKWAARAAIVSARSATAAGRRRWRRFTYAANSTAFWRADFGHRPERSI
jgi:16S rRNA (cytidine1402-2'-O)-methyltransferase